METLNELDNYDFPDTEMIPNGYDVSTVATSSPRNFRKLVEEYNLAVQIINDQAFAIVELTDRMDTLEKEMREL